MSTRSNILIRDKYSKVMFYRHSDGYPEGQESLMKLMEQVKLGKLRNNVSQCSGWLIVLGFLEYNVFKKDLFKDVKDEGMSWKVGAYEPCGYHGSDIEYFYICDLDSLEIIIYTANLWNVSLGKYGLLNEKMIEKAISKGWLKEIGRIKEFEDLEALKLGVKD